MTSFRLLLGEFLFVFGEFLASFVQFFTRPVAELWCSGGVRLAGEEVNPTLAALTLTLDDRGAGSNINRCDEKMVIIKNDRA